MKGTPRINGLSETRSRRRIEQSPLSDAPAVPRGTAGTVEDESDGWYWVDFGEPYGVVCCDRDDLQ
jgi:hypothetical protein